MPTSLYMINPGADHPTYFSAEIYAAQGFQPATLMADLAIPTVAALAPRDFEVTLCDENIAPVDFDMPCGFVGITGKITQHGRMVSIAREFRRRGKTVLIGGPYATLSPETLRPHCDILVIGEMENIADELFSDLRNSTWKEEYSGDKPASLTTPVPRWSAYPNHRALFATLQTSRGCPFECEFCDVIQYLGRTQRHKPVANVLAELEEVQRHGYRTVFLADDNLTVNRSRAKELLAALKHWNDSRQENKINFLTQVSIDAARDTELLRMCAEARLRHVFIGIETPNEESLKETKKRQNVGVDLSHQICQFLDQGIAVTAGMIVGFDSDGPGIFERQYEFAMALPVPVFSLGALVAPAATPLHRRLEEENRLIKDGCKVAAAPWDTNIIPKSMSRAELLYGVRWLCNRLYRPDAFGERMSRFIAQFSGRNDRAAHVSLRLPPLRKIELESLSLLGRTASLGPEVAQMFSRVRKEISQKPHTAHWAIPLLTQYVQIRHMYDRAGIWDHDMGAADRPSWEKAGEMAPDLSHFANVSAASPNGVATMK